MKSKQGFTLVELLIVVVIAGIIFALASPLLQTGFNAFFTQQNLSDAEWQGRLATERMSRDLRAIPTVANISTAGSNQLIYLDSSGSTVNYQLSGTDLTLSGNVLARGINNLTFTYYDANGAVTGLIANIRYIDINLNITQNNTNTTLSTLVNLRNLFP